MSVQKKPKENGQILVFYVYITLFMFMVLAGVIILGRVAYARGEVQKAADAAALAAASRLDVAAYRDAGVLAFLPDAYSTAVSVATMNTGYLNGRHIGAGVTGMGINPGNLQVSVTVSANLSSLFPEFLPLSADFSAIGYAKARMQAASRP